MRSKRLGKWLFWSGAVLMVGVAALFALASYYMRQAEPILRASLVDTLQKRFQSRVELDGFSVSILDGFWAEGRGLRVWLPAAAATGDPTGKPWLTKPWIVVDKLRFHTSWKVRPGEPVEISVIHVEGVQILLPPKADRPHFSLSDETVNAGAVGAATGQAVALQRPPQKQETPLGRLLKIPSVVIRRIECKSVSLTIERSWPEVKPSAGVQAGVVVKKPAKVPLNFALAQLDLVPDGKGGPLAYDVVMTNPLPVGLVHSTGRLGPWVPGNPGDLPVEGDYHFDHADLSTIKGIAGMLSSTGHYAGTLRRIVVDGRTEMTDFRLERVGPSIGLPLTTHFHATVDGTNGDVWLDPVDAMLDHTHLVATGQVVRAEDGHGHDVRLQVRVDRGRIEDFLRISTTAETPFMIGNLTLEDKFHLPPGEQSVWDRLELDGSFHLTQARFGNSKMQGRIEQLSLRGQGRPQEIRKTDPTSVLSEMQGHFSLAGGKLVLPDLDYRVPGAEILMRGVYGLTGGTLDFVGNARTEAPLSKMVGGWKGLLLKPADRFFRRNGAESDVPIHLKGSRQNPVFGLDLDRIGKPDEGGDPH